MKQQRISTSLALIGLLAAAASAQESGTASAQDSINRVQVQNEVLGPIGFSGNMLARMNEGLFFNQPTFAAAYYDRATPYGGINLKMVANPNPMLKLSTVVNVGTNFNGIYRNDNATKSEIPTITGQNWGVIPDTVYYSGGQRALYIHNNEREVTTLMEEMIATADIRTQYVKTEVQAGSALWVDESPLTIYRRDNRPAPAWYYEAYEPEQAGSTMYTYKLFNREDWGGQPVWPRKTFGGVLADAYELPAGFKAKVMVAEPTDARPLEKQGNTMTDWGDREALTSVSNPGWLTMIRVSNTMIPFLFDVDPTRGANRRLELAFNYLGINFNDDIIHEEMDSPFAAKSLGNQFRNARTGNDLAFDALAYWEKPYYVEPQIFSFNLQGMSSSKSYLQTEIALSKSDTTWFVPVYKDGTAATYTYANIGGNKGWYLDTTNVKNKIYSDSLPVSVKDQIFQTSKKPATIGIQDLAFYFKNYNESYVLPFMVEAAFIGHDFNSPYGMTNFAVPVPVDEMVVGSGTLAYQRNEFGANIRLMPRMLNGYLRIDLGEYWQAQATEDVIRFEHLLTGRDIWQSSFSWSRFDPTMPFDQGHANKTFDRVDARVGEIRDQFRPDGFSQQDVGGYLGDDHQLWERFAVYGNTPALQQIKDATASATSFNDLQAKLGAVDESQLAIGTSRKANGTIAIDWGTYISPYIGIKNPFFVNIYAEANAVDKGIAVPFLKDSYFNTATLMLQTALAVTPTFHLIGLAGAEHQSADNTLRLGQWASQANVPQYEDYLELNINQNGVYNVSNGGAPQEMYYAKIDYTSWALGAGFDWDFCSRAGFHFRVKYDHFTDNAADEFNKKLDSWTSPNDPLYSTVKSWENVMSYSLLQFYAETKVWF